MKKKVTLLIAVLMVCASFTGCGCESESAKASGNMSTVQQTESTEVTTKSKDPVSKISEKDNTASPSSERDNTQSNSAKSDDGSKTDSKSNTKSDSSSKVTEKYESSANKVNESSSDSSKAPNQNSQSGNQTSSVSSPSANSKPSSGTTSKPNSTPVPVSTTKPKTTRTEKIKVVDQEAYTYEEPIYEMREVTICYACDMDITYTLVEHMKKHALTDGAGRYGDELREVQTGTRTVTVPEKWHWETVEITE